LAEIDRRRTAHTIETTRARVQPPFLVRGSIESARRRWRIPSGTPQVAASAPQAAELFLIGRDGENRDVGNLNTQDLLPIVARHRWLAEIVLRPVPDPEPKCVQMLELRSVSVW
jgi:hypothetical protein